MSPTTQSSTPGVSRRSNARTGNRRRRNSAMPAWPTRPAEPTTSTLLVVFMRSSCWEFFINSNPLAESHRHVVRHGHFRRQFFALSREHPILSDLKRNFLAVFESLKCVLLLCHAGADEQSARQFHFNAQHDAEEISVAQQGTITIGLDSR